MEWLELKIDTSPSGLDAVTELLEQQGVTGVIIDDENDFKDFLELFPDKGPRDVKKVLTKLVNEEVLEFWSSGSTTMYGLKGAGKQSHAEGED